MNPQTKRRTAREPRGNSLGTGHRALGTLSLFEPSVPPPVLPVLDERASRGATFHEVPVKAILNSPATTGMGFWSLNPYVGCEFGCTYCYARETHKWMMERLTPSPPLHGVERGKGGEAPLTAHFSLLTAVLPCFVDTASGQPGVGLILKPHEEQGVNESGMAERLI